MGSHLDGEMVHAVTEFWQLGAQREEVGQPRWPRRPRRGAQGPTCRHGKHLDALAVVAFLGLLYQYYTMWLLHKLTHLFSVLQPPPVPRMPLQVEQHVLGHRPRASTRPPSALNSCAFE